MKTSPSLQPRERRPASRVRRYVGVGAVAAAGVFAFLLPLHRGPTPTELPLPAQEISRGLRGFHRLALTFDAGGEAAGFETLLAALEAARVHSTFFVTGQWASAHPEFVRQLASRGHEIGNHTWTHPYLTRMDADNIRAEITHTDTVLTNLIGSQRLPYWRPPFGDRNARVLRIAAALGYTSIYWTLDSLDSVDPPKTPEFILQRVTSPSDTALDGAIILLHVGEPATASAVPQILANLQHRGFTLVTVSALLSPR